MIGLYPTWFEPGVGSGWVVVAQGMRAFAKRLSREEIEALATYYADLPAAKH